MKLPRGLSGQGVARLLARHYGYRTGPDEGKPHDREPDGRS